MINASAAPPTIAPSPTMGTQTKINEVAVVGHSLIAALGSSTDLDNKAGYFHGKVSASFDRQGVGIPPLKPIIEAQLRDPKIKAVAMMAFANQADMPPEKFKEEITRLITLAKENNKKLILVTEPTNNDNGSRLGNMEAMNQIMRDLAKNNPNNIGLVDVHKFSTYNPKLLHQAPAFSEELARGIEAVATQTNTSAVSPIARTLSTNTPAVLSTAQNPLKVALNGKVANIGVQYDPSGYEQTKLPNDRVLVKGPSGALVVSLNPDGNVMTTYLNPEEVKQLPANTTGSNDWLTTSMANSVVWA